MLIAAVLTAAFVLVVPPPPAPAMETQVALAVERRALPVGMPARQPETPLPGAWWWWEIPTDRPARTDRPRDAARGPPPHAGHPKPPSPPSIGDGLAQEAPRVP